MSAGCEWPRFCRHDPTGEKMNLHLSEISQKRDIVRHYGFNGVDGCRTVGFCFFYSTTHTQRLCKFYGPVLSVWLMRCLINTDE